MALEAVVFPQDLFGYTCKEWYTAGGGGGGGGGGAWGCDLGAVIDQKLGSIGGGSAGGSLDSSCSSSVQNVEASNVNNSASPETLSGTAAAGEGGEIDKTAAIGRRKRQRTKCIKNKEEVESQRMTHITVERNRRKQMNEYLSVLRSLMPPSYVQRGDQASIVGAAINYVKELEQLLQSFEVQKRLRQRADAVIAEGSPFADFFTFPQYKSCSSNGGSRSNSRNSVAPNAGSPYSTHQKITEKRTAMADIEVTMVESHANVKVLSKWRPRQLLKLILGLQGLRLTPLHLNVTTVDQMVLFSFSLKVEDDCSYTSVDEIAAAMYQMLGRIQEEAAIF